MGKFEYAPDGTKQEKSGWRDRALSIRHREYGFNCPAADIDFLLVEYNLRKPVAIVEYKFHLAGQQNLQNANYAALADLADGYRNNPLPFYIGLYWRQPWAYKIQTGNEAAKHWFSDGETLSEYEYVRRLYLMRRAKLTDELQVKLDRTVPEGA